MTDVHLTAIAKFLAALEAIGDEEGMYLTGKLEIRHGDGFRIGFVASYEDWWVFIPDYKEDDV